MPSANEEREAITKANYEVANAWHEEKSLAHSWADQREKFISIVTPGGKILEVGAGGSGRDTSEFVKRGFAVEPLDYSSTAVRSLKEKFPTLRIHEADMRKISLPDASYNGIWACAAIVNLDKSDVPKAVAEFYRLLKPGGRVFISAKEGGGEKMVPDKAGERFFNFFTTEDLAKMVREAGFSVSRTETTLGLAGTRWICVYAVK